MSDVARSKNLLTRAEAAAFLGVSLSQLAHGWGPSPLPGYKRPVMYSRRVLRQWMREQEAMCCTVVEMYTGQSLSTQVSGTVSPQVRRIYEQQQRKRVASALKRKTLLVPVDGDAGSR